LEVPVTSDPRWQVVWDSWSVNRNAYWFHSGKRAGVRDLPPKKTRQLIYAFYTTHARRRAQGDFLVNYIDADSAPLPSHFKAGAAGISQYDVVQATNIAGNLLQTLPASWFAFDHIIWDANKYAHLTADGKHPFWVLGKGLFYKASDLYELGGFHPWITIEDPEVGLRLWKHGKRLGVIESPLIEEVPNTLRDGITQRKRWVAGFFQSLHEPLQELGYTRRERVLAWMNFLPCLSLVLNSVGLPLSLWGVFAWWDGDLSIYVVALGFINLAGLCSMWMRFYYVAWTKARIVLPHPLDRIKYIARVNPFFLWLFWVIWIIPLWLGWRMYRKDTGLVWDRTVKHDSNHQMVREGRVTGDG
jgi:cellulose synthase/poly-beta-1,6-N-acetylglucosamine synthase-like glycosyltransferase